MPVFHLVSCQWVPYWFYRPLLSTNRRAEKDIHEVTIFEKLFIVFALAFALAEYTATRENGWRSMFPHVLSLNDNPLFMLIVSVYMANVTIPSHSHNQI
jgi:hypothetical protein